MPLIETKGAASAQGFGLTLSSGGVTYIEDVFSTYLYDGTAAAFSINNSIDLAGKGGLVWLKRRNAANSHWLYYQATKYASSNNDGAGGTSDPGYGITSYNSNGFSLGLNWAGENSSGGTYVSWTFRKQPKFFDIVTYTGNGANRTIAHNLGSVPGCIMVKCLSTGATSWAVYHRSNANTQYMVLNSNAAVNTGTTRWNSTTPTSTVFSLGTDTTVNASGGTYVAYLFAHNAGGFGLSGTDNVISCGSYTGNGANSLDVTIGFEPQWLLIKRVDGISEWHIFDTMRGQSYTGVNVLFANESLAEGVTGSGSVLFPPSATGFSILNQTSGSGYVQLNLNGATYIYIAIRRGPMKVPTSGTSVFSLATYTGTAATRVSTAAGFPIDSILSYSRSAGTSGGFFDRLRGATYYLETPSTGAETSGANSLTNFASMTGYTAGADTSTAFINYSGTYINWMFQRAPGFFDVVCYTGTGVARTVNHNLGVAPELMLICRRSGGIGYMAYSANYGTSGYSILNTTEPFSTTYWGSASIIWNNTAPTSSVFSLGTSGTVNSSAANYVAYLYATCAGVSKVGSYTGTGALQTINCGFTAGARFVLIKRTDSTGGWYVYDSARGISSSNDPYLLLNSSAAEVTGTNYVDTTSVGFQVTAAAPAELNANGGTYIFLAIA